MNTKQLRQKILDLAIRGKLVPQDPNDEPASVLLERIKAEKEKLIKEGKIKRSKKSATTADKPHYPFEIPENWIWATLGEISNYGCCNNVAVDEIPNDAWILEMEDLEKDSARILQRLTKSERQIKGVRHSFHKGEILYSKLRTYLNKVLVADKNGFCTTEIMPFSLYGGICAKYINIVLRSKYFVDYTIQCGYGVKMPRLSTTDAHNGLIPLPPLKEQLMIVHAVENLIFKINLIENNKEELLSLSSNLKNKILLIAIKGKLVPQDPADEPAGELLRRINPSAVPADKSHYELPANWVMAKGKDLFLPMKSTTPKGSTFKYIDIDSIDNINQCISAIKVLPVEKAPSRASRYTEKNNVLFSMVRPYLRNIALVTEDDCIASTGFYVCRQRECLVHKYLFYLMISNYVVDGLNMFMKGDNSPSINKGHIDDYDFPLPPLNEQKRIVAKIDELFNVIDQIQQSLEA